MQTKEQIIKELEKLLTESVRKNMSNEKTGLLFSGGVDSTILALLLKKLGYKFTCYTSAVDSKTMKEAEDLTYAKKAADMLGLKLKIVKIKEMCVERYARKVINTIGDCDTVKIGVGLPIYSACEQARKDGCKVIISGLGSEEIFAGYERHRKAKDVNKECASGLKNIYERDIQRDLSITGYFGLELKTPFLDKELVDYALKIPGEYKIQKDRVKGILRDAALQLGLDKEIAERKKRAAQYGSNFHKAIRKLARNKGFKYMTNYLGSLCPKVGALVSSGKDSVYAMYLMRERGFDVKCMIAIKSKNKDSFMFHTPGVEMVKLQSESFGIPLIEQETLGEKEEELKDLKKVLEKAKKKYDIGGVVTGALYSNYQKKRIENVAGSLGLRVFSPLWHINQEKEMRDIIDSGFRFIITKVCSDGLDKRWLGRVITHKDVDKLVKLGEKFGFNVSGEGGEFETLMIDGPIFRKKIEIKESCVKEESDIVAELVIKKVVLNH